MDKTNLVRKIEELQLEKDSAQSEAEGLKIQLHVVEDKWQNINTEFNDTIRKLKEGTLKTIHQNRSLLLIPYDSNAAENSSESLRKELTDIRRQLADVNFEKEKYHATNKELRDHVKRAEAEKRDQTRQIEEAFQKISSNYYSLYTWNQR